jgi:hypothetical protein
MSDGNWDIVKLASYIALVLAAVLFFLRTVLGVNVAILDAIREICVLIGIGFAAFAFARSQRHIAWQIIFWVAVVVYIIAIAWTFK